MNEFDEIEAKLRRLADERHKACHSAIDDLVSRFRAIDELVRVIPGPPTIEAPAITSSTPAVPAAVDERTNVDRVLDAIQAPKTVEQIAAETGLSERQVRGVVNSKTVVDRVETRRINKKMTYRLVRQSGQSGPPGLGRQIPLSSLGDLDRTNSRLTG